MTRSQLIELISFDGRPCHCENPHPDGSGWVRDAQGIELARCCPNCVEDRLSGYRPEILTGYTQADVDEPIEEDV